MTPRTMKKKPKVTFIYHACPVCERRVGVNDTVDLPRGIRCWADNEQMKPEGDDAA